MTAHGARGFTLIELMTAVAIIAILAAIAYPSYQEAMRKTMRAEGRAALMRLMQEEERYYSQATTYIAFSAQSTAADEKKFKWFSGDSARSSAYEIVASACDGELIRDCILLTAKPGTDRVNASYKDSACGNLMLTSTGTKAAAGNLGKCWQ